MSNSRFKIRLSAPYDKNGMIIQLSVVLENWFTLRIQHQPDFSLPLFGFAMALVLSVIFFSTLVLTQGALLALLFLVWSGYELLTRRSLTCTIDKQSGDIHYSRGGVLDLQYGAQESHYPVSEISRLEMQRHIKRWGDTFQIYLLFNDGQRLPLSSSALHFSECQEFAEKIRGFLEIEGLPVKAVD